MNAGLCDIPLFGGVVSLVLFVVSDHHVTHVWFITQKGRMPIGAFIITRLFDFLEAPEIQLANEGHEGRLFEPSSHQRLFKPVGIMYFEGSAMW